MCTLLNFNTVLYKENQDIWIFSLSLQKARRVLDDSYSDGTGL